MAGALDCDGQRPLMLRAGALLAASLDLAPIGHVPPNASDVLVVDFADVVHAEGANFAAGRVPPASATTGTRRRGRRRALRRRLRLNLGRPRSGTEPGAWARPSSGRGEF